VTLIETCTEMAVHSVRRRREASARVSWAALSEFLLRAREAGGRAGGRAGRTDRERERLAACRRRDGVETSDEGAVPDGGADGER